MSKEVFGNHKTVCCICQTPLNGNNLLRRGNLFYCESDYQKTSPEELRENAEQERKYQNYRKLIGSTS